eukprot:UC1_evm4s593
MPAEVAVGDSPAALQILGRLQALPLVADTWTAAAAAYTTYGRESSSDLIKAAIGAAEATAAKAVKVAAPLAVRHADTIAKMDAVACKGLEHAESTAASLTSKKNLIVNAVTETINSASNSLNAKKDAIIDGVNTTTVNVTDKVKTT